ncbi:MAG TPA: N-acetylmuramoyl-L-alanine amidase [Terriglobales bacterium]|nr:N-acetylmuramoyl-L-alanine amidase [Terriglobales bacterium]
MRSIKLAPVSYVWLLMFLSLAPVAQQQRLSIYTGQSSFSLNLTQRDGKDYVGLQEALAPLGSVSSNLDGRKWRLRFNGVDGEFEDGSTRAKIRGHGLDLTAAFHLDSGRGIIPISSLPNLLPRLLDQNVQLHESGHRLFIGNAATRFAAQLIRGPNEQLVLSFSSAVNPTISTEPGALRMVFQRDPVVQTGPNTLALGGKTIPSLSFFENNGAAQISIPSNQALMARFSSDRKTITIATVASTPAALAPPAQGSAAPAIPTQISPTQGGQVTPAQPTAPAQPAAVVIDPSHGGSERGAALTETLAEKDVTLSIARLLQRNLRSRGISTTLLRDSDVDLTLEQRAVMANSSRAQIYVAIHAGTLGTGVRIYSALLPPSAVQRGRFLPWEAGQSPFLGASQNIAAAIATEIGKAKVTARFLSAPLPPLNSLALPAVGVEVAPPGADVGALNTGAYQEQVAAAVATGVAAAHSVLTQPPTQSTQAVP